MSDTERDARILAGQHIHSRYPEGDEHCHGGTSAHLCSQWERQLEEWREGL
ncbi:hypothetical protein [Streptomyces sp. CC53]|uniref:hypothetical protein n=1 Tax=Streptomyces sp. CC53 TaxID=1906740 RepID=UPI0015A5FFE3|nr:hypothetical protein [Streptomyces sp. CC53]